MSDPNHLIAFLIAHEAAIDRLVDAHTDDGSGHCRACTSGGQTGRLRFPCAIRRAALAAQARVTSPFAQLAGGVLRRQAP